MESSGRNQWQPLANFSGAALTDGVRPACRRPSGPRCALNRQLDCDRVAEHADAVQRTMDGRTAYCARSAPERARQRPRMNGSNSVGGSGVPFFGGGGEAAVA